MGAPTEAQDWACWTLAAPRPGPLLRRLLGLFPKKPPHTPLHKHPSREAGARRPRPVYSPPVFRLTSTEILNVLYTPGPCVSPGEGGMEVGSVSAPGGGGQRAPAGNGPRVGAGAGTSQPPYHRAFPCPSCPLHAPSAVPSVFFQARCSPSFSPKVTLAPVASQVPARCSRQGVPLRHPSLGTALEPSARALGPSAMSSRRLPASCGGGTGLRGGAVGCMRARVCRVSAGGRRVGKGVILTMERGPWAAGGEKEKTSVQAAETKGEY